MGDSTILHLAGGGPATLADAVPIGRAGTPNVTRSLTVQNLLDAAGVLPSGSPAALTDILHAVRSNAAIAITVADLLALGYRRNYVDNGNFEVNQRNIASYALTTSLAYGSVDRWAFAQATAAAGVAQVQSSSLVGFRNRLRLARNAGATSTGAITAVQIFETSEITPLQGKQVCLSWRALAGAQFSAAGSGMGVLADTGTGSDQSLASYAAGSWTGQAHTLPASNVTINAGAWAQYFKTFTMPATATQLAAQFGFSPTGTAGADDAMYITGVRLDEGAVPPTITTPEPYSAQLARCQRSLPALGLNTGERLLGFGINGTSGAVNFPYKARTRVAPTGVAVSANADWNLYNAASAANVAITGFSVSSVGVDSGNIAIAVASGLSAGALITLFPVNANGLLLLTGAEL